MFNPRSIFLSCTKAQGRNIPKLKAVHFLLSGLDLLIYFSNFVILN